MITRISSIGNFGSFRHFNWNDHVVDKQGNPVYFEYLNVLYGRNYSGKTTLSRIIASLESASIDDKFSSPCFEIEFGDGTKVTSDDTGSHGKKIRVFNTDFVRTHLAVFTQEGKTITSFSLSLGEGANEYKSKIKDIQNKLGSLDDTQSLRGRREILSRQASDADDKRGKIDQKISADLTNKAREIRRDTERYNQVNYDKRALESDLENINGSDVKLDATAVSEKEHIIKSTPNSIVSSPKSLELDYEQLWADAELLIQKKVSVSHAIKELAEDGRLNEWVEQGYELHADVREAQKNGRGKVRCKFCGEEIASSLWTRLESHFNKEYQQHKKAFEDLLIRIEFSKEAVSRLGSIEPHRFTGVFAEDAGRLQDRLKAALRSYEAALSAIATVVKNKSQDMHGSYSMPRKDNGVVSDLEKLINDYEELIRKNNLFVKNYEEERKAAREALRLHAAWVWSEEMQYFEQIEIRDELAKEKDTVDIQVNEVSREIKQLEDEIAELHNAMSGEGVAIDKINDYLGYCITDVSDRLSLQCSTSAGVGDEENMGCFKVCRGEQEAHFLSEGEQSLIAFCYFVAKLGEVADPSENLIVWIDDPISSLDDNNIYAVFGLIEVEICKSGKCCQLFVSTHSLTFLRFLKELQLPRGENAKKLSKTWSKPKRGSFLITRIGNTSKILVTPEFIKEKATEFHYLFNLLYEYAEMKKNSDIYFERSYSIGMELRRFLEMYLSFKIPVKNQNPLNGLPAFLGDDLMATKVNRLVNDHSHLRNRFEAFGESIAMAELQDCVKVVLDRIQSLDPNQYDALLESVGKNPA